MNKMKSRYSAEKKLLTLISFMIYGVCNAQNLIPNGDFELRTGCPSNLGQLSTTMFWLQPTTGTSDYFDSCATSWISGVPHTEFGYQPAHSGGGYGGIRTYVMGGGNYREYLETPFYSNVATTLVNGQCYHFQMYVNLCNHCKFNSSEIGVYFSDVLISGVPNWFNLPYVPQITNPIGSLADTLNWMLVSGDYVAMEAKAI